MQKYQAESKMLKLNKAISITAMFLLVGCATTHQYQGNNLPSLSSPEFPSFSIESEIKDGLIIKLPEATGKTKIVFNLTISKEKQDVSIDGIIDWAWGIRYKNNLVYNNHVLDMILKGNNKSRTYEKTVTFKADCIHDKSGKQIKMDMYTDDNELKLTTEELDNIEKQMSDYINNQFAILGKRVKSGDILKYHPIKFGNFEKIADHNIQDKVPEIIKGLRDYNKKRVMVTEFTLEDSIHKPNFIMEIRGRGCNLYDAEHFIQLFGKGVFYMSVFSPKNGTFYIKLDMGLEAYDVQLINIIN
jgi:hypothetical protein